MAAQVTIKIEAKNILWQAKQSATSCRWIAVCQPMNLVMEADSIDELRSLINEAMQLLLVDLLQDNELEEYLRERGWKALPPAPVGKRDGVQFDVAWELMVPG